MNARIVAVVVTLTALLSVLIAWLWGAPPLARLSFAQGTVERDRRGAEQAWLSAEVGNPLDLGDGLRTGNASSARLSLARGTVLQVDADTTLRLLSAAPGQESFRIERGSAQVEAGEAELSIETSAGTVHVQRKGRVQLRETPGDTWVRVDMGKAELGWSGGRALQAGQEETRAHRAQEAAPSQELSATAPRAAPSESAPVADEGVAARVRGDVRIQREGEPQEATLSAGAHRLSLGTRVTVAADSALELEQGQGGSLVTSGRAELVVGDGEHVATRVLSGKLRASAGRVPIEIEVPGGRIVLLVDQTGAAAATLRVSAKETEVDVAKGAVKLASQSGEQTLRAGRSGRLADELVAATTTEPSGSSAIEPALGAQPEGTQPDIAQTGPALVDVLLPLGTSTEVHDPAPPTAVAFTLGAACGGRPGVLEQATRTGSYVAVASGSERVSAWFSAGSTAYRVRCQQEHGSKVVATGRVGVRRDAGERQVTQRAPEFDLDLDGRKYTAVYQTLLPRVHVHLPKAVNGKLVLHVSSGANRRSFPFDARELTLDSGQLRDGEHSFELEGSDARVKPTVLAIRFDNTAPAAYVESAASLVRGADGRYTLRGGALPGSEVSVDGARVPLDANSRFETELALAPGTRAFWLAIKHPRAGSHYYVRRVPEGGAP